MDEFIQSPCSGISSIIHASEKDLGGFSVRRYIPHMKQRKVGPFVFFDHMLPAKFKPGNGIDVRPHPHIGLATITYLFDGEIVHRDSLGYVQSITPGAVNWMTAGRGVVHSERTGEAAQRLGQTLHGIQVWVALPEQFEEVEPDFIHFDKTELPVISNDGVTIRIIVGKVFSEESPVKTYSPLFYLDVEMGKDSRLILPEDYAERALHIVAGQIQVENTNLGLYDMAICNESEHIEIKALQQSRFIIFGGEAMTDRFVWWNFVSSSRKRIEMAKQDWKNNKFEKVPGESEFIPLPDES